MRRGGLPRLGPPFLLLALLLLGTAAGTMFAWTSLGRRDHDRLRTEGRAAVTAIGRRVDAYDQILRGAAAFYDASDRVTYQDFHRYFSRQRIAQRFPGIRVIAFASAVARPHLAAYEHRTQRAALASGLGYPRFAVHPGPAAGTRDLLVVDHLEPVRDHGPLFGEDLLSELNQRRAALVARRTGAATATAPIELVQSRGTSLAVELMLPVYAGAPSLPGAPRRWAGVLVVAFRVSRMVEAALGPPAPGVTVEVYDLGPAATVAAVGGLAAGAEPFDVSPEHGARASGDRTLIGRLAVGQRRWAVAYHRSSTALSPGERAVPWIVAGVGILVSLLAAALLRSAMTSQARAMRLAAEMTDELRERELQLQRTNEELEHFAYLASHDLQEPLRTIRSYVGLLESRAADRLDERARTWLAFISDGAARMSHLIADLLDYSRTGRADEPAQATSLEEAWDVAVGNLEHAIAESGATVMRGPLPVVEGRPREMTSMLQNLIGNALKYRSAAPPEVTATARMVDGRWEMSVRDNGIGIDPRFHDRVFGLFQRLHTTEEYPGTGMGLAIVKKTAEAYGGCVRVESNPGGGTTFVDADAVSPMLAVRSQGHEALSGSEPHVELDVVRHGEDALAFLRREGAFTGALAPDLVVLDLNLPRMGGFEVLRALRSDGDPRVRRLPVVVFTTSDSSADVHAAYDLHASSFVTKPTVFEHYLEVVRAFREFWLRAATLPAWD